MSAFAYELAQLGLFVRARQFWLRRFEFEIERINHHLTNYKPSFDKTARTPTQSEENPISMSLTDLSQDGGMNRQGAEALS
jgi:predicted AAA+ superfamily ATPase